jgi:hypothetical protein
MATATVKFVISNKSLLGDTTQDNVTFYGSITFSAASDTYATGGLLPLAGGAIKNLGPYADRTPLEASVYSQSGSGFQYFWNQSTGKLQIFAGGGSATAPAELTNGTALSASTPAISTDVVLFRVVVPRSIS